MKEISKKIVEAGLVDKHTLSLMRRWGYLDEEVDELKRQQFVDTVKEFVEDLDELLEAKEEEGIKETRFSIVLSDPMMVAWRGSEDQTFVVFHDEADNLIFPPNSDQRPLEVGDSFWVMKTKKLHEIEEIVPLWYGETLYAFQVKYI